MCLLTRAFGRSGTGMPMCLLAVVAFLFLDNIVQDMYDRKVNKVK